MRAIHITSASICAITGWLLGSNFEKYKSKITVNAATILPAKRDELDTGYKSSIQPTNRTAQIMKFGFPSLDNIHSLNDYVMAYDRRNRIAHWVIEHLTAESLKKNNNVDRSKCEFHEDASIHPFFRSSNVDYKHSGYDRGHLAAAGNHRKFQEDVEQTFLLTNMCPQVGKGFNRNSWNKLEKYVRHLTQRYKNIYVCTGPLFLPRKEANGRMYIKYEVIGKNHVAVPTHFFKVIVCETDDFIYDLEAYVMPNQVIDENISLSSFMVPVESIERAAGLLFFDKLNKENFRLINSQKNSV